MGRLINTTKNKVISTDLEIASGFFERLIGLMFRGKMERDEAIIITKCNSVHSFFMKFPIDVIFLDKDRRVVKIVKNLQPWRVTHFVKNSENVVELAARNDLDSYFSCGDIVKISRDP